MDVDVFGLKNKRSLQLKKITRKISALIQNLVDIILFKISGNIRVQKILEKTIIKCEFFMGIGTGTNVHESGERFCFILIKNRNPIIFDVGANQGQFAKEALDWLNKEEKEGKVYSFEPSKKTYSMMTNNIANPMHIAHNIGLGKEKTSMRLYYDEEGSGLSSLTKRDLEFVNIRMDKFEIVHIDTVDNFCSQNNIIHIDLLKIDVEGHELDVLYGASKMLNNTDIVLFEFGGTCIDTKTYFKDFYNFFNKRNMTLYRLTPTGYLYKIDYYKELDEKFRTTNFVAKKNQLNLNNTVK